jgi:hypothetical protein
LRLYLTEFQDIPGITPYFAVSEYILEELSAMGLTKISDFDRIIPNNFVERYAKVTKPKDFVTYSAIIRDILLIHDTKRYFEKAYQPDHYETFEYHSWKVFNEFGVNSGDFPVGLDYKEGSDD